MIDFVSNKPHYENVPFEIPESWEWVTLDFVCSKIGSGSTPKGSNYSESGIPFFRSQNVYNDGLVFEDIKYISEQVHQSMIGTEVKANDLLLNITGGSLGRCAIVPLNFTQGNVSQHVCILRPIVVLSQYIHAFILSAFFAKTMKITGSGREGLPKYNLEKMIFPLPPLAEQQRIAAEVEKWFALIDELEVNKEDLTEYIKQVKSKVLDLAIHGKLVPQDPNDEPAIELLKRINPNFKPCDTSHYENLPQGWTVSNLLDICKISTGKWDANHAKENGKYRFYTCASKHAYSDTKRFSGECLIVPGNGDIGAVYYFDGDFDAYQRTYVLDNVKIYAQYLYYHFLSNWRQLNDDKKFGSTIKFVRIGNFQDYKVLIPPHGEQRRIVTYLNNLFTAIDSISEEL